MDNQTKIRLSSLEKELVQNSDWILTKNAVMQKAWDLLGQVQTAEQTLLASYAGQFPSEVIQVPPKISRGENYRGLPWLVLDCPRFFEKENHFAIRTLFWWGKFFSVTLHLSGRYKYAYSERILTSQAMWAEQDYFLCTGQDEWEHHFEKDNYTPINAMDKSDFVHSLNSRNFLKLAKRYPLSRWDDATHLLQTTFTEIIGVLAD